MSAPRAWAAELLVSPVGERLERNVPGLVEIALVDGDDHDSWNVHFEGGRVHMMDETGRVRRAVVLPEPGVSQGWLSVQTSGLGPLRARLDFEAPRPSRLAIEPLSGVVGEGPYTIHVRAPGPLAPESLQVVLGEGVITSVKSVSDGAWLTWQPEAFTYPRDVGIGVRDLGSDAAPVWRTLSLEARLRVPIESSPGVSVRVFVGERAYGPVQTDALGHAEVLLRVKPSDSSARWVLRDASGNETTRSVPLATGQRPAILALVDGARRPHAMAPPVWLYRPSGPLSDVRCRTPVQGELPLIPTEPHVARVVVGLDPYTGGWDQHIACEAPGEPVLNFRIPLAEGIPTALRTRIWPEVLSADFPVADLAVLLENALGERLAPMGRVLARAEFGTLQKRTDASAVYRAEYHGLMAAEMGDDTVFVAWYAPQGRGEVDQIALISGGLQPTGQLVVRARVLDALQRPLAGRALRLRLGSRQIEATSGEDGWVEVALPVDTQAQAWVVTAEVGAHIRHAILLAQADASGQGPGSPDLQARIPVRVDPGRVASLQIETSTNHTEPGPAGPVTLALKMLDRQGLVADDPKAQVVAPEGRLEGPARDAEGRLVWRWTPANGFRPRDVKLKAVSEALDVTEETSIRVAPRPIRSLIGVFAGMHTNFGVWLTPAVSLDGEWRVKLGERDVYGFEETGRPSLVVRAGVGWMGGPSKFELAGLGQGSIRMDLMPISLALLMRQPWPRQAFWVGGGIVVAPWWGRTEVEGQVLARGSGVFKPGLWVVAGYGYRVPGGELGLEIRGDTLSSPGNTTSFRGLVGGLTLGLSYRVGVK